MKILIVLLFFCVASEGFSQSFVVRGIETDTTRLTTAYRAIFVGGRGPKNWFISPDTTGSNQQILVIVPTIQNGSVGKGWRDTVRVPLRLDLLGLNRALGIPNIVEDTIFVKVSNGTLKQSSFSTPILIRQ